MLEKPRDALTVDGGREQLGQGRGDGVEQGMLGNKTDVGLDGEFCRGKRAVGGFHVVTVQPDPFGELEPAFDAAVAWLSAIVILDPATPFPTQVGIHHLRDQGGVLPGDGALVTIPVEHPSLDLALGRLAAVQEFMERMLVVIALVADGVEPRFQFLGAEDIAHRVISMPSWLIFQPWASTSWRSGVSSSRVGLELLM